MYAIIQPFINLHSEQRLKYYFRQYIGIFSHVITSVFVFSAKFSGPRRDCHGTLAYRLDSPRRNYSQSDEKLKTSPLSEAMFHSANFSYAPRIL